jgi:hypothetical protein
MDHLGLLCNAPKTLDRAGLIQTALQHTALRIKANH